MVRCNAGIANSSESKIDTEKQATTACAMLALLITAQSEVVREPRLTFEFFFYWIEIPYSCVIYYLPCVEDQLFPKKVHNDWSVQLFLVSYLRFRFLFGFKNIFLNFIFEEKLSSNPSKNDSLREQLEEVVKQMLLVWAKEGIALKMVSGEKNGMRPFAGNSAIPRLVHMNIYDGGEWENACSFLIE